MTELTEFVDKRFKGRFLMVKTEPKNMRYQSSVNVGLAVLRKIVEAEGWFYKEVNYWQKVAPEDYHVIGFNIFYVTNIVNVLAFLRRNHLPLRAAEREHPPYLIGGGMGITNPEPLRDVLDIMVLGDGEEPLKAILQNYFLRAVKYEKLVNLDGVYYPRFSDAYDGSKAVYKELDSPFLIKNSKATIEISRGCRYHCKFCQYSWVNQPYREKLFPLVIKQIDEVLKRGVRNINFLSCDLGSYSCVNLLLDYCIERGVRLLNTDFRIDTYLPIADKLEQLKVRTVKVGLESFCEKARVAAGKNYSDELLDEFVETALHHKISNLHFYLIFGLPNEDYDLWLRQITALRARIQTVDRPIRLEFSITNFEPSPFTPYAEMPWVNFVEKAAFVKRYLQLLEQLGVVADASKKTYKNMHGRLGRKPEPYLLTMSLLHGNNKVPYLLWPFSDAGVNRSINQRFLKKIKPLLPSFTEGKKHEKG